MHQRLNEGQLLAIAFRKVLDLRPQIQVEPLRQLMMALMWDAGSKPGEEVQELIAGHGLVEVELSWQVSHLPFDLAPRGPAIKSEDLRGARTRAQEPYQDTNRGCLAGAIRPEKPENLPFMDGKRDIHDASPLSVGAS